MMDPSDFAQADDLAIFWFRRDLRMNDNAGLYHALKNQRQVLPIFIFDRDILDKLNDKRDRRVTFLHREVSRLKQELEQAGGSMWVLYGEPKDIFGELATQFPLKAVYTNRDYEPYARERDSHVARELKEAGIGFHDFKDQVIFEQGEVLKDDGKPYTVYTPYSRKWKAKLNDDYRKSYPVEDHTDNLISVSTPDVPSLEVMGFEPADDDFPATVPDPDVVRNYHEQRDIPGKVGTTRLGLHLRFGTVSIRELVRLAEKSNETWLSELIWREFFMMILWHFPNVVDNAFKSKYDRIPWRNDEADFKKWCQGQTGYPIVDAGMRELNATGFMHNRVRMITASFLVKHLLIDWRWGEAYFAEKLLDFDLSANNGNWQWAAGSGCDAAPYFRVFSPDAQTKKFDPQFTYIRKWVPEFEELTYPRPMVEHKMARLRAIDTYKAALNP